MGPCLCGDPYCASCGDPSAAKLEAAEEALMDTLQKVLRSPLQYAVLARIAEVIGEYTNDVVAEASAEWKTSEEIARMSRDDF